MGITSEKWGAVFYCQASCFKIIILMLTSHLLVGTDLMEKKIEMTSENGYTETVKFSDPFQTHISIYKSPEGWKVVKCEWKEDHWSAIKTLAKVRKKKAHAIKEGKKWAEKEKLPFLEK